MVWYHNFKFIYALKMGVLHINVNKNLPMGGRTKVDFYLIFIYLYLYCPTISLYYLIYSVTKVHMLAMLILYSKSVQHTIKYHQVSIIETAFYQNLVARKRCWGYKIYRKKTEDKVHNFKILSMLGWSGILLPMANIKYVFAALIILLTFSQTLQRTL